MTVDREELRRLCEAATPVTDDMIHRYDHGGGRVMVFTPYRDLVADFYSEKDRECWIAARAALPTLIDALDEAEAMVSALNGDVTELGQRLEAAEERERGLRKALEEIARQKLHAEITDCDPDELDWLGGYEGSVKRARSAIAETAP